MKTLYDIAGGAPANKMSSPLHYFKLADSDNSRPSARLSLRSGTALNGVGLLSIIGLAGCSSLDNSDSSAISGSAAMAPVDNGGGGGDDTLTGGTGVADTFVVLLGGNSNNGNDTITDFEVGRDIIRISWQGDDSNVPADFTAANLSINVDGTGDNATLVHTETTRGSHPNQTGSYEITTETTLVTFTGVSDTDLLNQFTSGGVGSVIEIV